MPDIFDVAKIKYCPLCHRKFTLLEENGKKGKVYFVCEWCKIILWIRDIFIGEWEKFEDVPCPVCSEKRMNFFCNETGYCKWYCPKCKATVENYDPGVHAKAKELKELRKNG